VSNGLTGEITGLKDLNRKLALMKSGFNGPPLQKLCLQGAREVAAQAKRNVRRGPTGLLVQSIVAIGGRKAWKYGAAAVARAKWRGTGAVFEEWGTKERSFNVMRIPLGKLGGLISGGIAKSGKFKKGSAMGIGGFLFARKAKPMKGTRFFENAVEQKLPEAARIIQDGCKEIIQEAIR
jgi:hypothetical protein